MHTFSRASVHLPPSFKQGYYHYISFCPTFICIFGAQLSQKVCLNIILAAVGITQPFTMLFSLCTSNETPTSAQVKLFAYLNESLLPFRGKFRPGKEEYAFQLSLTVRGGNEGRHEREGGREGGRRGAACHAVICNSVFVASSSASALRVDLKKKLTCACACVLGRAHFSLKVRYTPHMATSSCSWHEIHAANVAEKCFAL